MRGETVTHIFVTHPIAITRRRCGRSRPRPAPWCWRGAAPGRASAPYRRSPRLDAGGDLTFQPDQQLADGEMVTCAGLPLEAVATPGHTANHMAYALRGTTFCSPAITSWRGRPRSWPRRTADERLHGLARKARAARRDDYFPGHGGAVRDAPDFRRSLHPPSRGARRRSCTASPRVSGHSDPGAGGLYRARSAAGRRGEGFPPSPISRIWWRAGKSRPTARRRLTVSIVSPRLIRFGRGLAPACRWLLCPGFPAFR